MIANFIGSDDLAQICRISRDKVLADLGCLNPKYEDVADYYFNMIMSGKAQRIQALFIDSALEYIRNTSPTVADTVKDMLTNDDTLHLGSYNVMLTIFNLTVLPKHYEGIVLQRNPEVDYNPLTERSDFVQRLLVVTWRDFWTDLAHIAKGNFTPYEYMPVVYDSQIYRESVCRNNIKIGHIAQLAYRMEVLYYGSRNHMYDIAVNGCALHRWNTLS